MTNFLSILTHFLGGGERRRGFLVRFFQKRTFLLYECNAAVRWGCGGFGGDDYVWGLQHVVFWREFFVDVS